MNELDKFLPTPPQVGPPLPSILRAHWPWLKQPPEKEKVLPIAEAPELVTAPAPVSEPARVSVATQAVNYEVESPPEVSSVGMPSRISPDWIRV